MKPHRKNVVVTGSSGIAAATARSLASNGHSVFVISRTESGCESLATALGSSGAGWAAVDLRDEASTVDAFSQAAAALEGIDAVVAVAGGSARKMGDGWLHDMSLDAWDASLQLNLSTMFLTAREAVRHMRNSGGSLVLTSSVLATSPQPEGFATHGYAAAKAAISGWTTSLAAAYARDQVAVNTVAPGLVRTPMAVRAAEDPTIVAFAERKQPLSHGFLSPEQVASALCWFVDAQAVTGQVLSIDGGWGVTSTS